MTLATNTAATPATWLTARRLRTHGAILALCVWTFYAWNLATPGLRDRNGNLKGTDFLHFYTLGLVADEYRGADLYDISAQAQLAARRVPEAAGIRYLPLYPPQVSIVFAPLARLSYGWALFCWWVWSAILYGLCCYAVWRACPGLREYRGTVAILAAAFPAFFHLIAWGQTSAIPLACFVLMFFLLRDQREILAGLVFGCLIFKPQLGVAGAILFLSIGAWKTLAGASISAAAQLFLGILYYGIESVRQWVRTMWNVQAVLPMLEPKPYQTHSLRTFWSMLVPWPSILSHVVHRKCRGCAWINDCVLEAECVRASASALCSAVVGERARGAASHGLRSGDSGACANSARRLARGAAAHDLYAGVGNVPLPGVYAATAWAFCPLDARPAVGGCNGAERVSDLEDLHFCSKCERP